jgi:hypothetical protein
VLKRFLPVGGVLGKSEFIVVSLSRFPCGFRVGVGVGEFVSGRAVCGAGAGCYVGGLGCEVDFGCR